MGKLWILRIVIGLIFTVLGISLYISIYVSASPSELSFSNRLIIMNLNLFNLEPGMPFNILCLFYYGACIAIAVGVCLLARQLTDSMVLIMIASFFLLSAILPIASYCICKYKIPKEKNIEIVSINNNAYKDIQGFFDKNGKYYQYGYYGSLCVILNKNNIDVNKAYDELRRMAKNLGADGVVVMKDIVQRNNFYKNGKLIEPAPEIVGHAFVYKDSNALRRLTKALKSKFRSVRQDAAWRLWKLKDPQSVGSFMNVLKQGDEGSGEYHYAITTLAELRYEPAFSYIFKYAKDNKSLAPELLGYFPDKPETLSLLQNIADSTQYDFEREKVMKVINKIKSGK